MLRADELGRSEPAVFLPAREVFSMFEGFIAAYQAKLLSFDETYFDLCVALGALPARGPGPVEFTLVNQELERLLGGKVRFIGGRFYLQNENGLMESHLHAEGFRKLGTIFRLMQNGPLD